MRRIVAMWSGPRNISTALMRAWGSRSDTVVIDEPFYAHYLQRTGYQHPGAAEIIAAYETDWRAVIEGLISHGADEKAISYQKHMTHHMLSRIDRDWLRQVSNCFLIRDPRRMLLSYARIIAEPRLEQLGLTQQVELFETVRAFSGKAPPVISARGVLQDPAGSLRKLCEALGIQFDAAMLSWDAGPRETDGIWAKHWYASVEASTGFTPWQEDDTPLPRSMQPLYDECRRLYDKIAPHCIN